MAMLAATRKVVAAVRRKARMAARRGPRLRARLRATEADYAQRPPVVVTTVPKSGTHLVHQIVQALPGTVDFGTFLATTPGYRRAPRSVAAQVRRVRRLAPGEIARAHLRHHPDVARALRERGAFVVFVCRDPRDVAVSEAHYLTELAPWHVMHRVFSRVPPEERVDLAIAGLPGGGHYPDIGARMDEHAGWLDDADVVLRFEDLVSEDALRPTVRRLVELYLKRSGGDVGADAVDTVTDAALAAIDPSRSHTYREGRAGAWRERLTDTQKAAFDAVAAPTLERYGYPPTT